MWPKGESILSLISCLRNTVSETIETIFMKQDTNPNPNCDVLGMFQSPHANQYGIFQFMYTIKSLGFFVIQYNDLYILIGICIVI